MEIIEDYAQFLTATIYEGKLLLDNSRYKDIIVNSLSFLNNEKRVKVYVFVIMDNHIHFIRQMREGHLQKMISAIF